MQTQEQRENVLTAIAGYQLLHHFQRTGSRESWLEFSHLIDDLEHGDWEFALGLANLNTILLGMLVELTKRSPQEVLAAVAQSFIEIE